MSTLSIKAILTISLEGCVAQRAIESIEIPYETERSYSHLTKTTLVKTGSIPHKNLLNSEAKQRIKISQIAYEEMTSKCPEKSGVKQWNQLSKEARLKIYAESIANDLHGVLETIEIF